MTPGSATIHSRQRVGHLPTGVTTETVAVPINSGAPNPGTVPVRLGVTSSSGRVRRSDETVYLADSVAAVPPSIIAVQRVAGGIAITFSKPMNPARVQDIHNYAVRFTPSQQFNLVDLTGVGLIQQLTNAQATNRAETSDIQCHHEYGHAGCYRAARAQRRVHDQQRTEPASLSEQTAGRHIPSPTWKATHLRKRTAAAASSRSTSARGIRTRRRARSLGRELIEEPA